MKSALLIVLCLALLLGLFAAILDRHEALQKARLERLFPAMSSVRYHNGCCILRASAHAVRQLLHRVLGAYVRFVP